MTYQVLPKVSLSISPLLNHFSLVPRTWAMCHFLNTPVPTSWLYFFPLSEMPFMNALLFAEVLLVLVGLTQVPSLPRGPLRFNWLEFSFSSQFFQDTLTALIITSSVPQEDHHPLEGNAGFGIFWKGSQPSPAESIQKTLQTIGNRQLSPGLRQREQTLDTHLSRSLCCRS